MYVVNTIPRFLFRHASPTSPATSPMASLECFSHNNFQAFQAAGMTALRHPSCGVSTSREAPSPSRSPVTHPLVEKTRNKNLFHPTNPVHFGGRDFRDFQVHCLQIEGSPASPAMSPKESLQLRQRTMEVPRSLHCDT